MEREYHQTANQLAGRQEALWRRVQPALEAYPEKGADRRLAGQPGTLVPSGLEALPGAQGDPCCMGSLAGEMRAVLAGFIEEEREEQRLCGALAGRAPGFARQTLREIAGAAANRAKRLAAAYYLITGTCCQVLPWSGPPNAWQWCPALRERYHAAACCAMNYIRAAEGTADPCLERMLRELGENAYASASRLMSLLERAL